MDKQAQWDIETLQKTIGVIPFPSRLSAREKRNKNQSS